MIRWILGVMALAGIGAGIYFGFFNGGGPSKSAASTPTTTTTAPATTTPATITTGGGPVSGTTTTTTSTGPCNNTGQSPSAHGLVTLVTLGGPVTDGGTTGVTITVCKVSGQPTVLPNLKVGQSFDDRPFSDFANLTLPGGVYSFLDKSRNLFNLPTLKIGDSYTVAGTVNVPDRGDKPAVNFCIAAVVEKIGATPSYDSKGYPIPNWTDPVTQTCARYSVQ